MVDKPYSDDEVPASKPDTVVNKSTDFYSPAPPKLPPVLPPVLPTLGRGDIHDQLRALHAHLTSLMDRVKALEPQSDRS